MKVRYDREEDVLLIETTEAGHIDYAEHTGPFIAHFDRKGQLILLEVLDASEFIASLVKTTLRSHDTELTLAMGESG
jgi:uncharacterized protein YuzE